MKIKTLFRFTGKVIKGNQVGNPFGVATANLQVQNLKNNLPEGVFWVWVKSKNLHGVLHIGKRLTFGQSASVELHILDFAEDLYNEMLEIEVKKRLREVKKFQNGDALFTQIEKDITRAKKWAIRSTVWQKWETMNQKNPENRAKLAQKAVSWLQTQKDFLESEIILAYKPFVDEIPYVLPLHKAWNNKKWYFAEVLDKNLVFLDQTGQRFDSTALKKNEKVLVLTPAVAGNEKGARLGRGGGFYDRFLAGIDPKNTKTLTILPLFANYKKIIKEPQDIDVQSIKFLGL